MKPVRQNSQYTLGHSDTHMARSLAMLFETTGIAVCLVALTTWSHHQSAEIPLWICIILQGCWMQRIYCVGHESAHRKLFPRRPLLNNVVGQLFLWFLLVPLSIFQKIHDFHHSSNRRDVHTSALDVYVVPNNSSWLGLLWPKFLWFAGILCGGWFIHSLVSIVLFLCLPVRISQNISPAFTGWTTRDQLRSILSFVTPITAHILTIQVVGSSLWAVCYLLPFGVFGVVYSLQLYIYHYRTSLGPKTLYHARRLKGPKWISWWLLNLNEHDTHHQRPKIVWYALPESHKPLPNEFADNQNVETYIEGIIQQFNGPTLVHK